MDIPIPPNVLEETPAAIPEKPNTFAPYRWAKLEGKPNTYARQMWGAEGFYHQFCKVAASTADVTGVWVLSSKREDFAPNVFKKKFLDAWLGIRYAAPLVGSKTLEDVGVPNVPKHLGCFVYEVTKDKDELLKWANSVVEHVVVDSVEAFDPAVYEKRRELTGRPCGPESITRIYLISAPEKDAEGRWQFAICLNGAHSILDGAGVMRTFKYLFQLLARESFDPFALDWGTGDIENLPPAAIEAVGLDPEVRDEAVIARVLGPILNDYGPSMCLQPQRPFAGPSNRGTTPTTRSIEPADVKLISKGLKSRGKFNISHAIDTARHTAVWYLRAKQAARTGVPIHERYLTNLLLPIDASRFFLPRWKESVYLCSATVGFTTCIPVDFWKDLDVTKSEAIDIQNESFDKLLPVLSAQWGKADMEGAMMGVQPIMEGMGVYVENPVHLTPQGPADAFTSLGILDDRLPAGFAPNGDLIATLEEARASGAFSIDDFRPAPRLAYSQNCFHTWSRLGKVILSLGYAAEFDQEYMDEFLDIIQRLIMRLKDEAPAS